MIKAFIIFNKQKVDLVLHLGDWVSPFMLRFCEYSDAKIISIFGNNERNKNRYLTKTKLLDVGIKFIGINAELELDGKKFYICHGKSKDEINSAISSGKYDVVLSGHNHLANIEKTKNTIHINPGSTCGIKNGNINHELTVALYETGKNKPRIIRFE